MLANMTQEQTDRENREHCKRIAEEIEAIAEGKFYRCPDCGELYEIDDDTDDDGPHTCPNCDSEIEYPEQATLYDYFSDVYDIEYRISGNGEFRSVRLMVACGGPNIYVDTGSQAVELEQSPRQARKAQRPGSTFTERRTERRRPNKGRSPEYNIGPCQGRKEVIQ